MWLLHLPGLSYSRGLPAMVASERRSGYERQGRSLERADPDGRGVVWPWRKLAGAGPERSRLCETPAEGAVT